MCMGEGNKNTSIYRCNGLKWLRQRIWKVFLLFIAGWAGSDGKDSCACGVTGTCDGKAGSKCNCDAEKNQWKKDDSYIQNKKRLPVCRICATLKQRIPGKTNPTVVVFVQGLFCSQQPLCK